jgi:L-fuconolactonase
MAEPLIDTHLHLWDPAVLRYPWLAGSELLDRRHAVGEFAAASAECDVARAVFVQCEASDGMAEVRWVAQQAADDRRIVGIVAHAAVERGMAVREQLAELARQPLVRGIRRMLQGTARGFATQEGFIAGVRCLAEFSFSFDLCLQRDQLPEAIALVRACPQVRFVLDHLGNPPIAAHGREPWAEDLAALAALPNVWCKLSGIVTVADPAAWTIDDLAPYVDHALRVFGSERMMWGSDWPVVLKASDYRHWVDATRTLVGGLPEAARRRVLHDNAAVFYRLGNP